MKCQYIPIFSQGRESWCWNDTVTLTTKAAPSTVPVSQGYFSILSPPSEILPISEPGHDYPPHTVAHFKNSGLASKEKSPERYIKFC
jgi:hypothetical protein